MQKNYQKKLESLNNFHELKLHTGSRMLSRIAGSTSYNLDGPRSDMDFFGIYCAPTEEILSLNGVTDTIERHDPDFVIHEVGKFARLLLKGNPTIVESLLVDRYQLTDSYMDDLIANRDSFVHNIRTLHQYVGYCTGQLQALDKGTRLHTKGGEYNYKWAYHVVRLGFDALQISRGLYPDPFKTGAERQQLLDIRAGKYTPNDIAGMWSMFKSNILVNEKVHIFRESGDEEWLNKWLLKVRKEHYAPNRIPENHYRSFNPIQFDDGELEPDAGATAHSNLPRGYEPYESRWGTDRRLAEEICWYDYSESAEQDICDD